jgi:hypothetical protein
MAGERTSAAPGLERRPVLVRTLPPVDGSSGGERRVVSLEWDRGHETLIAIIHAESSTGFVISQIYDLCELPGRRWIRADEVVDVDDLDSSDPAVRLAKLRGSLTRHTVIQPPDLDALLRDLQDTVAPIAVYAGRTGSRECLIGYIDTVAADHLVLSEIDTNGTATGEKLDYSLSEIIGIDWGSDYLTALAELARAPTAGES